MRIAAMDWEDFYTSNDSSGLSPPASLSGLAGTRMSAMQVGDYTWVFYQREGDDDIWQWYGGHERGRVKGKLVPNRGKE